MASGWRLRPPRTTRAAALRAPIAAHRMCLCAQLQHADLVPPSTNTHPAPAPAAAVAVAPAAALVPPAGRRARQERGRSTAVQAHEVELHRALGEGARVALV